MVACGFCSTVCMSGCWSTRLTLGFGVWFGTWWLLFGVCILGCAFGVVGLGQDVHVMFFLDLLCFCRGWLFIAGVFLCVCLYLGVLLLG